MSATSNLSFLAHYYIPQLLYWADCEVFGPDCEKPGGRERRAKHRHDAAISLAELWELTDDLDGRTRDPYDARLVREVQAVREVLRLLDAEGDPRLFCSLLERCTLQEAQA